ncbi:MAG: DUF4350 domain-containing protein [Jatrophihabitans sp.]
MTTEVRGTSTGAVIAPAWRRLRFWVAFAVALIVGAVVLAAFSGDAGRPLDPDSASKHGSKALARLLADYASPVVRTTSVDDAIAAGGTDATILITAPDEYSAAQLDRLRRSAHRLVLVQPGSRTLTRLVAGVEPAPEADYDSGARCPLAGARASGEVDWPVDTTAYSTTSASSTRVDATPCFGGAVVVADGGAVVVLGSAAVLHNENLAHSGVAALTVNLLSADRTASRVVWLLPGADTAGAGAASIWDLFPAGAYRVFWCLIGVGLLIAVWRARRLGGVVAEPLPVIVRSAEVVEGHGRLYHRAGARDRAAHALRSAAVRRLTVTLGLPRGSRADDVAVAVAPLIGRPPAEVTALLAGAVPASDSDLVHLATHLDRIEAATGGALSEGN